MKKLRIVKDDLNRTNQSKTNKKRSMTLEEYWKFRKEYEDFLSLEETPVQKKRPRKLGNRIIPAPSTIHFKGKVIQNPFELKKMGYEPSKSCWTNFYKSRQCSVKNKMKESKRGRFLRQIFKKVA